MDSESFLKGKKLLLSLHIWCNTPESITDFATVAAPLIVVVRAQVVSHQGSQFPLIVRPVDAMAFSTCHHSVIRLEEMQSTLPCPGGPYRKQMSSSSFPPLGAHFRFLHASVILLSFWSWVHLLS